MTDDQGKLIWSWLHLSDIHFGHGENDYLADQEHLIREIARDAEARIAAGQVPKPKAILLTGDVAYSADLKPSYPEYDSATLFIEDLRARIDPELEVYAVPGNHDVQRTAKRDSNAAHRLIYSLRDGTHGDLLDESVIDKDDQKILKDRFVNYTQFCESVGSPVAPGADGLWVRRIDVDEQMRVHLIGINTALLSNDDKDHQKLRVPHSTSAAAVRDITKNDVVLLMTHHPMSWIDPKDSPHLSLKIRRSVDVHLHGHIHQAEATGTMYGTGDSCFTVTAGSVHADPAEAAAGVRNTYSFGALFRLDDGTLHLRIWPFKWEAESWVRDTALTPQTADVIDLALPRWPAVQADIAVPQEEAPAERGNGAEPLRQLAIQSVASVGKRRTAFPTDMSIEELYQADLVVPTPFGARHSRKLGELFSASSAVQSFPDENVLLLGHPGAGKTVILYEFSQTFMTASDRVPIFVDITDFQSPDPTAGEIAAVISPSIELDLSAARTALVFIVDGLDEALAAGTVPQDIGSRLAALSRICPIVVSCRRNDYEFNLAAYVDTALFHKIWYVYDWQIDQFEDFVNRLVRADLILDTSLSERIAKSSNLQSLVRRPLLARMLTFLADEQILPAEETALYSDYMSKLGLVSDSSANAAGCTNIPAAEVLWQRISWLIFSQHLNPDSIKPRVITQMATDAEVTIECVRRVLDGVLDLNRSAGTYVHYSFFEFLTALHIANELESKLPNQPESAAFLLERDLPIEIRHHLTRLLRQSGADLRQWPQYLANAYRSCPEDDRATALVVRNMIVYLACRLGVPADGPLLELLNDESEAFLRNSLQWALTQHNNLDALDAYIEALKSDEELASYNRGYLLYYYGDLPKSVDPPHVDAESYGSWDRTRVALNEEYEAEDYRDVASARKVIDMYTFCDIAGVRGDCLTESERERFSELLILLETQGISQDAMQILRGRFSQVVDGSK